MIELALESGAAAAITDDVKAAVQGYNQDDCRSTEALRDWLEQLRAGVGAALSRPIVREGEANEKVGELEERQRGMREQILKAIPAAASDADHTQHAHWLLAYLIDWHRREDKSAYWERYRLAELSDDELLEETQAIAGLELVERLEHATYKNGNVKAVVDRYRYPLQEGRTRQARRAAHPGKHRDRQHLGSRSSRADD